MEQLGRGEEVLRMLEGYAERDRHNVALKLLWAERLGRAGQFDRAEAVYLEIAQSSAGPEVFRGLFKLYAESRPPRLDRLVQRLDDKLGKATPKKDERLGDADAAAQARGMLLVLREDGRLVGALLPVVQQKLARGETLNGQTYFFLGVLAARTHQLDAAEQLFRSCLTPRGGQRFKLHEAEVYHNLLRVLRLGHKHEAIVQLCREGLEQAQATERVLFHVEAAQALSRLGRFEEGIKEANAAVEAASDPNRLFCQRARVQILTAAQLYHEAVAQCREMLKEHTRAEEVRHIRHTLSIVYASARDHAHAEEQLRLILQADPNDATANNDLGYIWADQGKNLEEAEKLVRKAIDLDRRQRKSQHDVEVDSDSDNAAYVDSLGWVLFRRGQVAAARHELEKASALPDGANDPVVWDHLADVYYRLGETNLAGTAWRKALQCYELVRERQADERYREIKQKLKLLEQQVTQP
jgi:tetratricopeptide (TPR) repeat protein